MLPYEFVRLRKTLVEIELQGGDPEVIAAMIQEVSPHSEVLIFDSSERIAYSSKRVDSFLEFL